MLPPTMPLSHEDRLRAFTQVAAALNSSLRLDDVLQRVLEFAGDLVDHPVLVGCVALFDPASATWRFPAWHVPPAYAAQVPIPRDGAAQNVGVLNILVDTADLIEIADSHTDPRLSEQRRGVLPLRMTAVPLVLEERVVGGIVLAGLPAGNEEREILKALGKLAAVAIRNAQLYEQAQQAAQESVRLAEQAKALRAIGTALVEEQDLNKLLGMIVASIRQLIASERAQIALLDETGSTYTISVVVGPNTDRYRGMRIPVTAQTLVGHAIRTRETVVCNDPLHDPRVYQPRVVATNTRNVLVAPLIARGRVIGALSGSNKTSGSFSDDDAALVAEFAGLAALAVDNARQFAAAQQTAVEQRAMRQLVQDISVEAAQALRGGGPVALGHLLRLVVDHVRELAQADGVGVVVPDTAGEPRWLAVSGEFGAVEGAPVATESLALEAIRQNRPRYTTSQAWTLPEVEAAPPLLPEGLRAAVAAPLSVAGAEALGALYLGWREDRAVPARAVLLAERAAGLAATALLNDRLVQQARDLGAMQERTRLARDLHDSVTQSLFSISALAQAAPALWDTEPGEARSSLEQIQQLSRDALAEMRALLHQLRPLALQEEGLPEALRRLTDSYRRRPGPVTRLKVKGAARPDPAVEEALFRIAQEAINNARRHSGAATIEVGLELGEERAVLVVRDNGSGFDPESVQGQPGHLGTISMRERAAQVGGRLKLVAAPGRGTVVRVSVPRCVAPAGARP